MLPPDSRWPTGIDRDDVESWLHPHVEPTALRASDLSEEERRRRVRKQETQGGDGGGEYSELLRAVRIFQVWSRSSLAYAADFHSEKE